MKHLVKIFAWGLIISFLGSLPLGTMNVSITHLSVQGGAQAGWLFALGAVLIELVYVRVALMGMNWISSQKNFFRLFECLTIILLLALSFTSFNAAINNVGFDKYIPVHAVPPILLGAFLSLVNPLHIPFWIGWSTILMKKNILLPGRLNGNIYVVGIGIGSFSGFAVFIYGSRYAIYQIKSNEQLVNYIIGIILLGTVLIQLYRMSKSAAIKKLQRIAG